MIRPESTAVIFYFIAMLLGSAKLDAQCDKNAKTQDQETTSFTLCKSDLNLLQPSRWGRFGRGFQYQYSLVEQPEFVLVGSGASTAVVQNPEHHLNQHSLNFQFSELFPSGNLATIVQQAYLDKIADLKQRDKETNKSGRNFKLQEVEGCKAGAIAICLANGGSSWQRLMSGFGVTIALSEHSTVPLTPEPPFTGHYNVTGGVSFDPKSIFVSGSNWAKALDAAQKMEVDPTTIPECLREDDKKETRTCLNQYSELRIAASRQNGRILDGILTMFIPKLDFKRTSQVDFVRNAGALPAEPALNTLVMTWDLQRLIAPAASRSDLDPKYHSYKSAPVKQPTTQLCVTISAGVKSYINVPENFLGESCHKIALDINAEQNCGWL